MSTPRLENKVALVTGAAQGIGRAIALAMAAEGADVVVNDLPAREGGDRPAAAAVVAEIERLGRRGMVASADVSDRPAVFAMIDRAVERFGRLDIAVSNCAFVDREPVAVADWERVRRVIEVVEHGLFHLAQASARHMIARFEKGDPGGKFIAIGSVHAELIFPGHAAYAMCKAGVNHFCRVFAAEMTRYRVNVNCINPGWTDTPGEREFATEAQLRAAGSGLPLGRMARPDDIAHAAVFLAGDAAEYISGSTLLVDGGFLGSLRSMALERVFARKE